MPRAKGDCLTISPHDLHDKDTKMRFCHNLDALQSAFEAKKLLQVVVYVRGRGPFPSKWIRPVGIWTRDGAPERAYVGFSPIRTLGEERVQATDIEEIEVRLA